MALSRSGCVAISIVVAIIHFYVLAFMLQMTLKTFFEMWKMFGTKIVLQCHQLKNLPVGKP